MSTKKTVTPLKQGSFEARYADADEALRDYGDNRRIADFIAEQSNPDDYESSLGITDDGVHLSPSLDIDEDFDERRAGERSFKNKPLTSVFGAPNRHRF